MSKSSNTVLGLLAGTAIGATLGILFAPDKGSITRQRLSEEAINAKDNLATKASEVRSKVAETYVDKKGTFDEKMDSILTSASYKAEDVITSLESRLQDLKARNKRLQKKKIVQEDNA